MNIFLEPFVEMLNDLSNEGIQFTVDGKKKTLKVFAICCCVDSAARPPMQALTQYNGYNICSWCLHPGEYVKDAMKFPLLEDIPGKRNQEDSLQHMHEAVQTKKPVFGFKNVSVLILLNYFDIVLGFVPDYLHNILLGIGPQFVKYWCEQRYPYTKSSTPVATIDALLNNIKAPIQISRRSRPLSMRHFYKGREWENWLLYYSLPLLKQVLQKKYLVHWSKLVEAIHILLSTEVTVHAVNKANALLHEFVADVENLYGKQAMMYNVHQLLHVCESVTNWGPLWAHNGFAFESGNGKLLKKIFAANGVCNQISRFINLQQSFDFIVCKMNSFVVDSVAKNFFEHIDDKICVHSLKLTEIRYFGVQQITNKKVDWRFESFL